MAKKPGRTAAKRRAVKAAPKKSVKTGSKRPAAKPKAKAPAKSRLTANRPKLPGVWHLTETAAKTLWQQKRLFAGITLVYGLLNAVLAQGLSSTTNVSALKQTLEGRGTLAASFKVFTTLIGSTGSNTSQAGGAYQFFLGLMASLAIIWTLRKVMSGAAVRVRDAYYRGMYPLVPFVLVLLAIGLQLLPALLGAVVYGLVVSNGIAIVFVEKLICGVLFACLALWSLYMASSSLFALYIVTLPDMMPFSALRSARELVRRRRWTVLRKILWLPFILLVAAGVIMVPVIILAAPLTQVVFFLLTIFALPAAHAYMYILYRELLNE